MHRYFGKFIWISSVNLGESSIGQPQHYFPRHLLSLSLPYLSILFFNFWDRVWPCNLGWPQTPDDSASASQWSELQVCTAYLMRLWAFSSVGIKARPLSSQNQAVALTVCNRELSLSATAESCPLPGGGLKPSFASLQPPSIITLYQKKKKISSFRTQHIKKTWEPSTRKDDYHIPWGRFKLKRSSWQQVFLSEHRLQCDISLRFPEFSFLDPVEILVSPVWCWGSGAET